MEFKKLQKTVKALQVCVLKKVTVYVDCTVPVQPCLWCALEDRAGLFLQHTHTEGAEDLGSRGPAKAVRICRVGKANLENPSRVAGRNFKGKREAE